jgi:hypothetical protein
VDEPLIYREEVTAVLGAVADIATFLRDIREGVRGNGEEEEEA